MKELGSWDSYVAESLSRRERQVKLPLTAEETFILEYPTRRQGKRIAEAQRSGDVDTMLVALLGEQAGARVAELSEDHPGFVLDEFLLDVMRKFGMLPDDDPDDDPDPASPSDTDAAGGGGKPVGPDSGSS